MHELILTDPRDLRPKLDQDLLRHIPTYAPFLSLVEANREIIRLVAFCMIFTLKNTLAVQTTLELSINCVRFFKIFSPR